MILQNIRIQVKKTEITIILIQILYFQMYHNVPSKENISPLSIKKNIISHKPSSNKAQCYTIQTTLHPTMQCAFNCA